MHESQKRSNRLVVACGYVSVALQSVKQALDFVEVGIQVFIVGPLLKAVVLSKNDDFYAAAGQFPSDNVGVVGLVGHHGLCVNHTRKELPKASIKAWILVINAPRLRPRASVAAVLFLDPGRDSQRPVDGHARWSKNHRPVQIRVLQGLENSLPVAGLSPASKALVD